MPPRLVRRAPLVDRLKAYLDPYDLLLWISEQLNDDVYDDWLKDFAAPVGIALNLLFILARGTSRNAGSRLSDDVFSDVDGRSNSGWLAWFAVLTSWSLAAGACFNAFYTFYRKRHYRLFEQSVEDVPPTPSAHRVRVDSSPAASSPLRVLQSVISSATAPSRSHPDAEREVWELRMWDPKPSNLALFVWFSPGHLLLYYALLPPTSTDPRPSVTIFVAVTFASLLSLQLNLLKLSFSQQAKDSSLIHGQVMNEYDTKFVRPQLNRPVRDVATQTRESTFTPAGSRTREVDVYTPTTYVNRGFKVNPNPNYASQYDPDNLSAQPDDSRRSSYGFPSTDYDTPKAATPYVNGYTQSAYSSASTNAGPSVADLSSPLKPHHQRLQQQVASPLRRAASSNVLRNDAGTGLKRSSNLSGSEHARRRETTGRMY